MIQAAQESGYYATGVWQGNEKWKGRNNLTGISPAGVIADYPDLTAYADAYARVIEDPTPSFNYPQVLAAKDVPAQLTALGWSSWNGKNHYASGGVVGGLLLEIWGTDQQLIDAALAAAAPQTAPEPVPSAPQFGTLTSLTEAAKVAKDLSDYLASQA